MLTEWLFAAAAVTGLLVSPATGAQAGVLKPLYYFTGGSDGGFPQSATLLFQHGALYGTVPYGGGNGGDGAVFEVNPRKGTESVPYVFTGAGGNLPLAGLVSVKGILYGTTEYGGAANYGVVFKLDPKTKVETVLHNFTGEPDGENPYCALIEYDGALYGTTYGGGEIGNGTVFKINPKTGAEKIIYSFIGGNDGAFPEAGVIYYAGNLYGTTNVGGAHGEGTLFRVNLKTVLHSFVGQSDGRRPEAGVTYLGGTLYGTTYEGGPADDGTVFAVDAKTGAETVVYPFTGGADGGSPQAGFVVLDGNLFSTAPSGGISNNGVIFEIQPATGAETVLYDFTNGGDGNSPQAGLIYEGGAFYGTSDGGSHGAGTVFKFTQ